jgi:hypothetical protein
MAYTKTVDLGAEFDAAKLWERKQAKKKQKGFLVDNISTGGGIGGAIAGGAIGASAGSVVPIVGTAAGGIIGALLGGALGGGGGQAVENTVVGDNVWKDVGQEALINGIMGAGPIRLGSLGARTVGGLAKGAGKQALSQAGTKAMTDMPIRTAIGKGLTKVGDNAAVRGLGLTSTQIGKIEGTAGGKDIIQILKANKLQGGSVEDVTATVAKLNRKFGKIVEQSGNVSKADVNAGVKALTKELTGKGMPQSSSVTAKKVKQEVDFLLKKYNGDIPAKELNTIKSRYDDLVNPSNFAADPVAYNANHEVANVLRNVLRTASEKTGAAGAGELKALGGNLSTLRKLQEAAVKQANTGKGNGPLGLRDTIMAVGGTVAGGPAAGVATVGATHAVNSKLGQRMISKGADALAKGVTRQTNGLGPAGIAGRVGITGALLNQGTPVDPMQQQVDMSQLDPMYAQQQGMQDPTMMQQEQEPSIGGYTKTQIEQGMMQALQAGDSKMFTQLKQLYGMLPTAGSGLSSNTAAMAAKQATGETILNQLEQAYTAAGGGQGNIGGSIANILGDLNLNSAAGVYNDQVTGSARLLSRAMGETGAGSDSDANAYISQLPRLTDSPERAAQKIALLRQKLAAARQNTMMYGTGGGDTQPYAQQDSYETF